MHSVALITVFAFLAQPHVEASMPGDATRTYGRHSWKEDELVNRSFIGKPRLTDRIRSDDLDVAASGKRPRSQQFDCCTCTGCEGCRPECCAYCASHPPPPFFSPAPPPPQCCCGSDPRLKQLSTEARTEKVVGMAEDLCSLDCWPSTYSGGANETYECICCGDPSVIKQPPRPPTDYWCEVFDVDDSKPPPSSSSPPVPVPSTPKCYCGDDLAEGKAVEAMENGQEVRVMAAFCNHECWEAQYLYKAKEQYLQCICCGGPSSVRLASRPPSPQGDLSCITSPAISGVSTESFSRYWCELLDVNAAHISQKTVQGIAANKNAADPETGVNKVLGADWLFSYSMRRILVASSIGLMIGSVITLVVVYIRHAAWKMR